MAFCMTVKHMGIKMKTHLAIRGKPESVLVATLLSVLFPPSVFLLLKKGSQPTALVTFFNLLYSVYPRIAQYHI